jgi:hypothetical protein
MLKESAGSIAAAQRNRPSAFQEEGRALGAGISLQMSSALGKFIDE